MTNPHTKLLRSDVVMIHRNRKRGWTLSRLCQEFPVSSSQLDRILKGMQWKEVWLEENGLPPMAGPAPELTEEQIAEYDAIVKGFLPQAASNVPTHVPDSVGAQPESPPLDPIAARMAKFGGQVERVQLETAVAKDQTKGDSNG